MFNKTLIVESRYCSLPGFGNGGYVAGRIAENYTGGAEVTLRKPVPLDTELTITKTGAGILWLKQGEEIIAEAQSSHFELEVPEPPTIAEAAWIRPG